MGTTGEIFLCVQLQYHISTRAARPSLSPLAYACASSIANMAFNMATIATEFVRDEVVLAYYQRNLYKAQVQNISEYCLCECRH